MTTTPPPLLPLLRSQIQEDLLALPYLHADREYSLTEAAELIGASVKTVHTEASRLVIGGLLHDSRQGNVRLVRAATDTPLTRPLTDLLAVTYGPLPVITELLAAVEGVDRAYIYGSWAARHQGEPGPVPEDVDVLVVGTADRDALDEIARTAQQRLGRPVNIRRLRARVWAAAEPTDSFVASLRQRPLVELNVHRRQSETATT
jgi:predicted nucleotidyltransferase